MKACIRIAGSSPSRSSGKAWSPSVTRRHEQAANEGHRREHGTPKETSRHHVSPWTVACRCGRFESPGLPSVTKSVTNDQSKRLDGFSPRDTPLGDNRCHLYINMILPTINNGTVICHFLSVLVTTEIPTRYQPRALHRVQKKAMTTTVTQRQELNK
jgi:hypothetical protein